MLGRPPPPVGWASEGLPSSSADPSRPDPAVQDGSANVEAVSSAWKHIKGIASRDEIRHTDLYDLLVNSLRESQYSFPPHEWPNMLHMTSSTLSEMPAVVVERYAACQTVAFCGVFPELRRAWASVDSTLFLWRFDRWQDVPLEYCGEDQSIVAVGLAPVRPGVFVSAIEHILVICTTVEILLVGVCCGPSSESNKDEWENLALAPLPLYTVPTDGVTMTCVKCTAGGRVFLGGADGHLYELQYRQSGGGGVSRWHGGRPATKVCCTAGAAAYLPSFLPSFLRSTPSPLVEIAVDDERHLLYTRTASGRLTLFDLGHDGTGPLARAAECPDFLAEALRCQGGREVFGAWAGPGGGSSNGADAAGSPPALGIAGLVVLPKAESARLSLAIVTTHGQRVFWSVHAPGTFLGGGWTGGGPGGHAGGGSVASGPGPRPDRLRAEFARGPPPAPPPATRQHRDQQHGAVMPPPRAARERVAAAVLHRGVLLAAESGADGATTRLSSLARDLSLGPVGQAMGVSLVAAALRESVADLPARLPGEACALRPIPQRADPLAAPDGASNPSMARCARFAVVTTAGVATVERRRPVDVLVYLLETPGFKLDSFFRAFGPVESAAACVVVAGMASPGSRTGGGDQQTFLCAPPTAIAAARATLADPRLCSRPVAAAGGWGGEAQPATQQAPEPRTGFADAGAGAPSFDMGAPVAVVERPWSAAHRGLCLVVARVLHSGIWDKPVFMLCAGGALLRCSFDESALELLERRLARLAELARGMAAESATAAAAAGAASLASLAGRGNLGAAEAVIAARALHPDAAVTLAGEETARTAAVAGLLDRASQGAHLLRLLGERSVGRLVARVPDATALRSAALALHFRDWVAGGAGDEVAASLVAAAHDDAGGAQARAELSSRLRAQCPAFFRADDGTYYAALAALAAAETARDDAERSAALAVAARQLLAVPGCVDLAALAPRLALLRCFDTLCGLAVSIGEPKTSAVEINPGIDQAAHQHQPGQVPTPPQQRVTPGRASAGAGDAPEAMLTAFQPVLAVMRCLLAPAQQARGTAWETFVDSVSARQQTPTQVCGELIAAAAGTRDALLLECLYRTAVDTGAASMLLGLDPPGLEAYLIRAGGLAGVAHASQVVAFTPGQAAHVALLARLYAARGENLKAAQAFETLAGAPDAPSLSLADRAGFLDAAVLQARSCGDGALLDQLMSKSRVLAVQRRMLDVLLDTEAAVDEETMAALQAGPLPLTELYNDVAVPHQLWSACIEMVGISNYGDLAYVEQLWDLALKHSWESGWASAAPDTEADSPELAAAEALEFMARETETLARAVRAPDDGCLPLTHVVLRLEQAATGQWPLGTGLELTGSRAAAAALAAAGTAGWEGALRAYDELLSGDAGGGGAPAAGAATAALRLRLLVSAMWLASEAARKLPVQTGAPRERAALTAAAEAMAAHARRGPAAGAEVAAKFEALASRLLHGMIALGAGA